MYLKEKPFENFTGGESYVFNKTMEVCLHPRTREVLLDPVTKVPSHYKYLCLNFKRLFSTFSNTIGFLTPRIA